MKACHMADKSVDLIGMLVCVTATSKPIMCVLLTSLDVVCC